jgi:hypothetical protein
VGQPCRLREPRRHSGGSPARARWLSRGPERSAQLSRRKGSSGAGPHQERACGAGLRSRPRCAAQQGRGDPDSALDGAGGRPPEGAGPLSTSPICWSRFPPADTCAWAISRRSRSLPTQP